MRRNPNYRIGPGGTTRHSDDITEILSTLVGDAMANAESVLVLWAEGESGDRVDKRYFPCTVRPVTRTMVKPESWAYVKGESRSNKEGVDAFTASLFDRHSIYTVWSVEPGPSHQGSKAQRGEMLYAFVSGDSTEQVAPEQAAKAAMAKAAAFAIEAGVVYLEALRDNGTSYLWEVWMHSYHHNDRPAGLTYSYGTLPSAVMFEQQFEHEVGDGAVYPITNRGGMGRVIPQGKTVWLAPALWLAVVEMVAIVDSDRGGIEEGDTVSAILQTLGMEWI